MAGESGRSAPTRGFWVIAAAALVWNLIGVMAYLSTVTMSAEALAALPEAQRSLLTDVPAWATSAYAIAVFGGFIGSVGLLLRKAWALPAFVISLIGVLVQEAHAFLMIEVLAVHGAGALGLPLVILVIAILLVLYARTTKQRGWIG